MTFHSDLLVSPVDDRTEQRKRSAPRLESLNGKAVGLLDNRKGNGNVILEQLALRLSEQYQLSEVVFLEKLIFSRPAAPGVLAELEQRCDAVITAVGD